MPESRTKRGGSLFTKRWIAGVAALLMVGTATSGTAFASSHKTAAGSLHGTLSLQWSPSTTPISADPFSVWMLQSISNFEKANPGVSFDVTDNLTSNAYLAKLDAQMAAHTTPDIFVGWTEKRMFPYAAAGRLLNLKSHILRPRS